jgi:hypothetical protein
VIFIGQDGQLVGCVERVDLLLGAHVQVGLADHLTIVYHLALLLTVVDEATIAKVSKTERPFVEHSYKRSRAADCGHLLEGLLHQIERV